jgi:adenylate kinase family enzyme
MPTYVIVTGLPASGKTTLAIALSSELGFEHLDKDAFLEALFDRDKNLRKH